MKNPQKIIAPILRNDFTSFIEKSFYTINPSTLFLPNWHIEKIASALELAAAGKIKRLIINIPPRYMKSLCTNVAWPAWVLGHNPAARIISASFNMNLSTKHSADSRLIMQSEWYEKIFPNTKITRNNNRKSKFVTTKNGYRMAVSVNSSVTGEGGNFLIVDDPISPKFSMSKKRRQDVLTWFDQTFSTRLDDKKKGVIVLVMQRLHEDDLSGSLLKRGGWEHLCFPALTGGNPLHNEREGIEELKRIRIDLGEQAFAAQYLQSPMNSDGAIIKKKWLKYYTDAESKFDTIYQSWDTAIKIGEQSDYSAGITFGIRENNFYITDVMRRKLEYTELKAQIKTAAEKWKPNCILIEDKAAGQSLLQDLRKEIITPVIGITPKYDKITRLAAVSPVIESGKMQLPEYAAWLDDFVFELLTFPESIHDDQVDALTQFLEWIKNKNFSEPRIRRL